MHFIICVKAGASLNALKAMHLLEVSTFFSIRHQKSFKFINSEVNLSFLYTVTLTDRYSCRYDDGDATVTVT